IEDRSAQLRQRLEQSEREMVNYASQQNIINLQDNTDSKNGNAPAQQSLQAAQLATLNEELARAEAERIRAQATPISGSTSSEAVNNVTLTQLRQRQADLTADYAKLMSQFEPSYPPAQA